MYKLTLIVLMMTIWTLLHVMQTNEEIAMKQLFQGKHAINRAAHAAAQQLDLEALSDGILRIDTIAAERAAAAYLQTNLLLDENGNPLPNSQLRDAVQVVVFDIINDDYTFPYTYRNDTYHYEATLQRPGVVMIIKMSCPRPFTVLEPIEWHIKGVSELVVAF
ncbi:MAG: hypothetical protein ACE3L7_18365 [Candidatus Pristimantibacillus sp.]